MSRHARNLCFFDKTLPLTLLLAAGPFVAVSTQAAMAEEAIDLAPGTIDKSYDEPDKAAPAAGAANQPAAASPASGATESAEMKNKRMQTLEGSKSRWSGQFQLQYTGSTLNHPFSASAPNPGHLVPPPVVTLQGTFSTRYRLDDKTTVGLGTGVYTQTPFQGPKDTTLSDPYADIAHSFSLGPLHSRVDLQYTQWTNHQYYHDLGYREGVTLQDETFYEFAFGLTTGVALQFDANAFAQGTYDKSQQTLWDVAFDPYVEYTLNDTFNFRSVVGILDYKNVNLLGTKSFAHPEVYQTLGIGIAATKSVFVYVYAEAFPYSTKPVASDNTLFGFSTIINLF